MLKIIRYIFRHIGVVVNELKFIAGIWVPFNSEDVDKAILEFITINKPYWTEQYCIKPGILIEGHLSNYGPNYLLRTAIAARAIQEKTGLDIDVVFSGYSHQWVSPKKVYQSFGIYKWVHLSNIFFISNFFHLVLSYILAFWYKFSLATPEDILKITFNSIKVGDLIYDDVIRITKKRTIERIDNEVTKCIAKSLFYYFQYRLLFNKSPYRYYVSTHTAYSQYGLLCRVALAHGVKVIETSDIQMSLYDRMANDQLPTYNGGIKNSILMAINNNQIDLDQLRVEAKKSLHQRLDSKISQMDAKKAYCGMVYTKSELRRKLNLKHEHKIVFVLAHVFTDSPHISSGMLYADYYQWLLSTLQICAKSLGVSWVIKPHPSSSLYGEDGLVEKMVDDLNSSNVFLCPADLNTKSLSVCADALVTVHGTAGLEFSCLGIPVVLAGKPSYSGFGFTIEPANKADYEKTLLESLDISPLTESQINKALEVYALWNNQFDWHNPIITSEVQANVWGSDVPRDIAKAYRLITNNLRANDPRKLKLWEFVQGIVE